MSDGNEAIANLQEKLEQACRILQQVSDPSDRPLPVSPFHF